VAVRVTLDTNILVYAIDESEGAKHTLAAKLLLRAAAANQPLMLQSLNELAAVVRQKRLMSAANTKRMIEFHRDSFLIEPPTIDDLLHAIQANEDHNLPLWDALLWATARRSGCKTIFSEDFQHNRELGGVRFLNPFKLTPRELQPFTS
jgi:predicted nucleic acid-binding protein